MQQFGDMWSSDTVQYIHSSALDFEETFGNMVKTYPFYAKIVDDIKPDFIVFDQLFTIPVGIERGIKWANLVSAAM